MILRDNELPKISVIIPSYNREYCITKTIDSVLVQTYSNFEILVIDDGSTDNTKDLILKRYSEERRVIYIYKDNGGVSSARNLGINKATGEFVCFLDSDDTWYPWKVDYQVKVMQEFPQVGMVWTDMEAINPEGKRINPAYLTTMYSNYDRFTRDQIFQEVVPIKKVVGELPPLFIHRNIYVGDIYSKMIMGNLVHTSTVMIRNAILRKVKKFDEDLKYTGEDYDFHLRTCRECQVAYIDVSSVRYQLDLPDRLTRPELGYYMARNFLTTIERAIQQDRERIGLSTRSIVSLLADANAFVGGQAFETGQYNLANSYLKKSLFSGELEIRKYLLWFVTCFPEGMVRNLRTIIRWIKSLF